MASSYLSEDADLTGAEAAYCGMEAELQEYLDTYEATHDYDEYHFDLDEIEHDPYVLLSILSALHEGVFTLDEVQSDLEMLFDKQYILTETVTTETRYRTETRTDSEGNEYEVRCHTPGISAPSPWKTLTSPMCRSISWGEDQLFHVCCVYVHPGQPPRSVSVLRLCGQVHREPAYGLGHPRRVPDG